MYRVMIVDDEKYIRKSIISRVQWDKYNLTVVGEAGNGEEAYHAIPKLRPDLMLVDIRMPKLDGLELAALLAEEYPDIKIIIITAYNDFAYAKQAIRAGVSDYLLKPLDEEELDKTLNRLLQQMSATDSGSRIPVLELGEAGEGFIQKAHGALACYVPDKPDIQLFWHEYLKPSALWEAGRGDVHWIYGHPAFGCQILYFRGEEISDGVLLKAAMAMTDLGIKHGNQPVFIGISPACAGWQGTAAGCIEQAVWALKQRIYDPHRGIFMWRAAGGKGGDVLNANQDMSILFSMIAHNDYDKVKSLLLQTIGRFGWEESRLTDEIETFVEETVNVLRRAGRQADCYRDFKIATHELRRPDFLLYYNSIRDVCEALKQAVHTVFEEISKQAGQDIIRDIKAFIGTNLAENLQIDVIAQNFYMNPSYISTMFKEKTHMTLSGYIEGVRMEKAKELIKSGACSVADAALAVGYADSNYFCKVFKKYTGMTPSKYRIL